MQKAKDFGDFVGFTFKRFKAENKRNSRRNVDEIEVK